MMNQLLMIQPKYNDLIIYDDLIQLQMIQPKYYDLIIYDDDDATETKYL